MIFRFNNAVQARPVSLKIPLHNFVARLGAALLISVLPASLSAQSALAEFTAYYKVIKGGITIGETKRSLKMLKPGSYEFSSETSPKGIFHWISDAYVYEQSQWRLAESEFLPVEYRYRTSNDDKIRDVKLMFDWDKNRVTNIINGDPWHMALQPGIQDKLLYQLKMMQDLQNGAENLSYSVADGGVIKEYKIIKVGNEILEIPLGHFPTVKLQRIVDDKTIIWWCAEQLRYLPIKIQQLNQQGGRVTAVLYKLEGIALPKAPASPQAPR